MKKWVYSFLFITLMFIVGCATTGKNYQTDLDSMNARISALQDQLSNKDREISTLQSQLASHQQALSEAEDEKRRLARKMDEMSQAKTVKATATASDLK